MARICLSGCESRCPGSRGSLFWKTPLWQIGTGHAEICDDCPRKWKCTVYCQKLIRRDELHVHIMWISQEGYNRNNPMHLKCFRQLFREGAKVLRRMEEAASEEKLVELVLRGKLR